MTAVKVNTNYGLQGVRDRADGKPGTLDVARREALLRPGKDGYVHMDAYNRSAPWGER